MGKWHEKIRDLATLLTKRQLPDPLRQRVVAILEAGSVRAYAVACGISRQAAYQQVDQLLKWTPPAERKPKPTGPQAVIPDAARTCQVTRCVYLLRMLGCQGLRNKGATVSQLARLFGVDADCIRHDLGVLRVFLPLQVDGDRYYMDQIVNIPICDFRVTYRDMS